MNVSQSKKRAAYNRTISLTDEEYRKFQKNLLNVNSPVDCNSIINRVINGDLYKILDFLPDKFINLLFIDPPYNLDKKFNSNKFKEMNSDEYEEWINSWLSKMIRLLKDDASIYICCDWKSSNSVYNAAKKYFNIQNRITWEREKGRGAKTNWKNCSEDIWFCTVSNKYTFNVEDVKLKRRVLAPYRHNNGEPKDWESDNDENYRVTHPSNVWTDITVPFWSMPENTDHPTQKPEKLLAKIILSGTNPGDLVFDPFGGSGTTSVVAKKLGRKYASVEIDDLYCCLTEKRLLIAESDKSIQGYNKGIFWERNTLRDQKKNGK